MRKLKYRNPEGHLEKMIKPTSEGGRVSLGNDSTVGEFYHVPIEKLYPYEKQARIIFSDEEIEELTNSIKNYGVRQPLTIRKRNEGDGYEIISGERRFISAKKAGLTKLPCIMLEEDMNAEEIALVENLHREDLHPVEFGNSCLQLVSLGHFKSQAELSERLSVSKGKVSECMALASLPDSIKDVLIKNHVKSREKLRSILKNKDDVEEIKKIIGISPIRRENYSVLRVIKTPERLLYQKNGIARLGHKERKELKETLLNIISDIEKSIS
jgi:ParB family transcriptional regulator, chromosome partitioning protein